MKNETSLDPKQLNIRVDPALYATVVAVAAMEGLSLSKWVERAMRWDLEANRKEYAKDLLRTVQGVAKIAFGHGTDFVDVGQRPITRKRNGTAATTQAAHQEEPN